MIQSGHWSEALFGEKGPGHAFALDFVRSSIVDDFLYRQYQEARDGVDGGYCLGSQDQRGRCLGCGACVDTGQREAITHHRIQQPEAGPYLSRLRDAVARKRRLRPVYYILRLDDLQPGVQPAFLNALLFREILIHYAALTDNLLSVRESLFTVTPPSRGRRAGKRRRYPTMGGESVFALYAWDVKALQEVLCEPIDTRKPTFDVVKQIDAFTPGVFNQVHLDLHLPADLFEQPRRHLEEYLGEAYVPYSLRRQEAQSTDASRYCFNVPAKGRKKKVILGGHFEIDEAGFSASLDVGPRFDLLAFLEQFGRTSPSHYAKLKVSNIRL
jgi:hypothetical protein